MQAVMDSEGNAMGPCMSDAPLPFQQEGLLPEPIVAHALGSGVPVGHGQPNKGGMLERHVQMCPIQALHVCHKSGSPLAMVCVR